MCSSSSSSFFSSSSSLIPPFSLLQVLATSSSSSKLHSNSRNSRSSADDLYLEDFGSGEDPAGLREVTLTHQGHEGSGRGPSSDWSPYGAVYDNYDDTEDDYDDYREEEIDDEMIMEGSGGHGGESVSLVFTLLESAFKCTRFL